MRTLEFSQGISQQQEVRHSTHQIKRYPKGSEAQFCDSGRGRVQNTDYEPLHYQDN